jgi:8-oxo-dGTP pyrophosphatase MutT (NUDIX family)
MLDSLVNAAYRTAYRIAYPLALLARSTRTYTHNGAGVAIWHEDSILLVKHSYRHGLLLPGGGVKSTENPKLALVREMYEELGIRLIADDLVMVDKRKRMHGKGLAYLFEIRIDQKPIITIDHREIVFADFVHISDVPINVRRHASGIFYGKKGVLSAQPYFSLK